MNHGRQALNPPNSYPTVFTIPALEQLEILLQKLKIQFYFCFGGILFTILGYLAIWSMSRCCELPFQESSCTARNIVPLPSTNYSTLGEEVDEFIATARAIAFNLHDAIDLPSLTDRQQTFEIIDYDLWQLIQQHSANLAAFGDIKREDERLEELEVAVTSGYIIPVEFSLIGAIVFILMAMLLNDKSKSPKLSKVDSKKKLSAEESDNSRNVCLKKLKRQIPMFYMATLICFLVQMGFYVAFFKSQSSAGHCPLYICIETKRAQILRVGQEKYLPKSFSDYHDFADKLQLTLDLHLEELNRTIQSTNLEVREIGWKYEYYAIEAAFRHHHSELKQYLVTYGFGTPAVQAGLTALTNWLSESLRVEAKVLFGRKIKEFV
ncbi:hypothetical protein DdX_11276 [Ditylenchus destructor]|uniref:Uncharacterized protein n=1 Tax=Ditylenchus destructor TaxID=166010 RepID=A0AAD4R1E4_9BILA|nr:hypothetical protein DdX_11276 [Ditylenchus destructor]